MAAKSFRLIWTAPALDDLDEIAAWIATENRTAADRLVRRVLAKVEPLTRFPESGRRVPELPGRTPYREVIVPPCRVIYRREGSRGVLIVHVRRSERLLVPADLAREEE